MRHPIPGRTREQRREAIERGVELRRERARLKQRLARGEITVADWFALADRDPDGAAARTRPVDLVRAMPGYGLARAQEVLDAVGVSPSRRVRGLGKLQREALARELQHRA